MIFLSTILAIGEVYFEAKFTKDVPWIGPWLSRVFAKYPLVPMLFSTLLSIFMGMFFGAAGLIVMVSGFESTLMMMVIYAGRRGGQFAELHKIRVNFFEMWNRNFEAVRTAFNQLMNPLMACVHIVQAFFVGLAAIIEFVSKMTEPK